MIALTSLFPHLMLDMSKCFLTRLTIENKVLHILQTAIVKKHKQDDYQASGIPAVLQFLFLNIHDISYLQLISNVQP